MSKQQMSKNEPVDKTVDLKLGKWREKSIAMEEERKKEEEERRQRGKFKCFMQDFTGWVNKEPKTAAGAAIGVLVLVILLVSLICAVTSKVKPEDYITVSYTGADGYAVAECSVDTEKLYRRLAGKTKDADKQSRYRSLAESVSAAVHQMNIANGQKVKIEVLFDKELAKELGVKIKAKDYTVRAKGIDAGTKIDLFSNVEVTFAGISPDADALVTNKWGDEYLGSLIFITDTLEVTVRAEGLSEYVQTPVDIDNAVLSEMQGQIEDTISAQTENTTFRMLYKATGKTSYLRSSNIEEASDIECLGIYFLKKKETADAVAGPDNYLYFLYQAVIENDDNEEDVYFAFAYSDGYVTSQGIFDIVHDENEKRYSCSDDYDRIYEEAIEQNETQYRIEQIQ